MSGRVLVVTQTYPPEMGGNASRIGDTTRHLADEGWDVTVLAPFPCYPPGQFQREWSLRRAERRDGVAVHRLWAWQPTEEDPGFGQRLAYYLTFAIHAVAWVLRNGGQFNVVLTSSPPIFTGFPGATARFVHGLPWIVDVRDLWIDVAASLDDVSPGRASLGLSRFYQRLALSAADRVFTTTPELRSQIRAIYDVPAEKIAVVPNGVDTSRFTPGDRPSRPRIIYTGNLGHAQDLETCIRAMQYIESDATFWIVGDGDRRSALRRLVADLGLEDVVEFVGPVDRERIPDLLASSSVGVAPIDSAEELSYAVPTKTYEYMATELPVVVTGTGAVERFVRESEAGFVEDDPERLAATFDNLVADGELRRRIGRNGRRYVVCHRDRARIARQVSHELHDVAGIHHVTHDDGGTHTREANR